MAKLAQGRPRCPSISFVFQPVRKNKQWFETEMQKREPERLRQENAALKAALGCEEPKIVSLPSRVEFEDLGERGTVESTDSRHLPSRFRHRILFQFAAIRCKGSRRPPLNVWRFTGR
jgi:hypothetical protein